MCYQLGTAFDAAVGAPCAELSIGGAPSRYLAVVAVEATLTQTLARVRVAHAAVAAHIVGVPRTGELAAVASKASGAATLAQGIGRGSLTHAPSVAEGIHRLR